MRTPNKPEPVLVLRDERNALTREGALIESRKLWGDLGTISHGDDYPRLAWCIGRFNETIGRGKTWEIALERSAQRKKRLDARELARMFKEAEALSPVEWKAGTAQEFLGLSDDEAKEVERRVR